MTSKLIFPKISLIHIGQKAWTFSSFELLNNSKQIYPHKCLALLPSINNKLALQFIPPRGFFFSNSSRERYFGNGISPLMCYIIEQRLGKSGEGSSNLITLQLEGIFVMRKTPRKFLCLFISAKFSCKRYFKSLGQRQQWIALYHLIVLKRFPGFFLLYARVQNLPNFNNAKNYQ